MVILSWVRLALGIIFLLIGMFLFGIQILALFKFRYVLDRMQAAAMGDTLGIGSSLLGPDARCPDGISPQQSWRWW